MRYFIRKPFRGSHYYEWQIGALVMQIGRKRPESVYCTTMGVIVSPKRVNVFLDPYWRLG